MLSLLMTCKIVMFEVMVMNQGLSIQPQQTRVRVIHVIMTTI